MTFAARPNWNFGGGAGPSNINLNINASSTVSYNIFTAAGSPAGPANVTVNIGAGVIQGGTSGYAMTTGTGWAAGSTITITSSDSASAIVGGGGAGGTGANSSTAGQVGNIGSNGLLMQWPVTLSGFTGTIAGGGSGGDGGGYGGASGSRGGGGGGGAGYPAGAGGLAGVSGIGGVNGTVGNTYPSTSGGAGGAGGATSGTPGAGGTAGTTAANGGGGGLGTGTFAGGGGGGGGGLGKAGGDGGGGTSSPGPANGSTASYAVRTQGFALTGLPGTSYGIVEPSTVPPSGTLSYNYVTNGTPATGWVVFNTDGTISTTVGIGVTTITNTVNTKWYSATPTGGIGSSYWIRWTVVSGVTPNYNVSGTAGTWQSLATVKTLGYQSGTTTSNNSGVVRFDISNNSSGTQIVASGTINFSASHT